MLNDQRLRARGWTEREITHATMILDAANVARRELAMLERATLGLLVAVSALGGGAAGALLAPLSRITQTPIAVGAALILGACFGLLFRHALLSLGSALTHRWIAAIALAVLSGVACASVTSLMGGEWLLVVVPLVTGVLLPILSLGVRE